MSERSGHTRGTIPEFASGTEEIHEEHELTIGALVEIRDEQLRV